MLRYCHADGVRSCRAAPAPRFPAARCRWRTRSSSASPDEPHARASTSTTATARVAGRRHQSRHHQARRRPRASSTRPIPSSQLACTHRRQHRHELGRRALPEIRRHHQQPARRDDGADGRHGRRDRRRASRRAGLRPARPDLRLGGAARHRHRGDGAHPARAGGRAARCCSASTRARRRAPASPPSSAPGIIPVAHRVHGPAGDPRLRGLRPCRLPARRRGAADRRGRGLATPRSPTSSAASSRSPSRYGPKAVQGSAVGGGERRHLEGPQGRLRRDRAASPTTSAWTAPSRPAQLPRRAAPHRRDLRQGYGLRVANVFHAGDGNLHPLILYDANEPGELEKAEDAGADILRLCVEVGGCLTGEHGVGVEKRDLMRVQFMPRPTSSQQLRVKAVFDPDWLLNPAKVFPLEGRAARVSRSRERGVAGRTTAQSADSACDARC